MLLWAVVFYTLAIVSAVLGFGVDGGFHVARVTFFVFIVCFVVALALGLILPRRGIRR